MPDNVRPDFPFRPSKRSARRAGLHRAVEERIGAPLVADARARAMAADEADIIAEWQQLFGDRADQGSMAAARQVGAADRAIEQHVANVSEAHFAMEEHHAARRMAG